MWKKENNGPWWFAQRSKIGTSLSIFRKTYCWQEHIRYQNSFISSREINGPNVLFKLHFIDGTYMLKKPPK